MKKSAQQWSLEAMLAIAVFVIVFVFMIAFIGLTPQEGKRRLELQSVTLLEEIRSEGGFLDGNQVNTTAYEAWFNASRRDGGYTGEELDALKQELGISGDFCVYFMDQSGGIRQNILHENDPDSYQYYYGVGDDTIQIAGQPCTNVYEEENP